MPRIGQTPVNLTDATPIRANAGPTRAKFDRARTSFVETRKIKGSSDRFFLCMCGPLTIHLCNHAHACNKRNEDGSPIPAHPHIRRGAGISRVHIVGVRTRLGRPVPGGRLEQEDWITTFMRVTDMCAQIRTNVGDVQAKIGLQSANLERIRPQGTHTHTPSHESPTVAARRGRPQRANGLRTYGEAHPKLRRTPREPCCGGPMRTSRLTRAQ